MGYVIRLQNSQDRQAKLWEESVPYELSPSISGNAEFCGIVLEAMEKWNEVGVVQFVSRGSERNHPDWVYIDTCLAQAQACYSVAYGPPGRDPGQNTVNINFSGAASIAGRALGVVVHELGHVLGFLHEHQRPDAYRHIRITRTDPSRLRDVCSPHMQVCEGVRYPNPNRGECIGPYDFRSIMHYLPSQGVALLPPSERHPLEFSAIRPRRCRQFWRRSGRPQPIIDGQQRAELSNGDKAALRILYGQACPRP